MFYRYANAKPLTSLEAVTRCFDSIRTEAPSPVPNPAQNCPALYPFRPNCPGLGIPAVKADHFDGEVRTPHVIGGRDTVRTVYLYHEQAEDTIVTRMGRDWTSNPNTEKDPRRALVLAPVSV